MSKQKLEIEFSEINPNDLLAIYEGLKGDVGLDDNEALEYFRENFIGIYAKAADYVKESAKEAFWAAGIDLDKLGPYFDYERYGDELQYNLIIITYQPHDVYGFTKSLQQRVAIFHYV